MKTNPPPPASSSSSSSSDSDESNDGLLHIKLRRLPEDTEIKLRVDPEATFDEVGRTVGRITSQTGPFRFVYRGKLLPLSTEVASLEFSDDESIYLLRGPPSSAAAAATDADPGRGIVDALASDPVIQLLTEDSNFFMSFLDANPQIRALRDRSPEFDSLLADPQLVQQLFRASRSPGMARELVRASDRAISRIDVIPGGMDALRQIYQDIHDPMFESLQILGSDGNSEEDQAPEPIPEEKIHEIADDPFPGGGGGSSSSSSRAGMPPWMPQDVTTPFVGVPSFAAIAEQGAASYNDQMSTLEQMGFTDREKNLDALRRHGGNLNRAIDDLVESSSSSFGGARPSS